MENVQKQQRARDVSAPIQFITLDGTRYKLAFTNRAARLAEDVYEQVYGRDVGYTEILKALSNHTYHPVRAVFYGALRAGGAEKDWEPVDKLFKLESIEGIREIIVQGVVDALPRDGGDDGENP